MTDDGLPTQDEYVALVRAYRRARSEGKLVAFLAVGDAPDAEGDWASVDVRLERSGEDMMVRLVTTPWDDELTEIGEERFTLSLPLIFFLRRVREVGGHSEPMLGTGVEWDHIGT